MRKTVSLVAIVVFSLIIFLSLPEILNIKTFAGCGTTDDTNPCCGGEKGGCPTNGAYCTYTPCGGGSSNPKGFHDSVDNNSCSTQGWTCDADNWNSQLEVKFYTNRDRQNYIGNITANQTSEQAVKDSCGGNNVDHRFRYTLPTSFNDGTAHDIYAFGINVGGGGDSLLTNSPQSITCPLPPTITGLKVYNSNSSQVTLSGTWTWNKISGNQSGTQGGSNWLNPMTITLNATPGVDTATISKYYVAFYNKSVGSAYTTAFIGGDGNPTQNIKDLLSANHNDGFILAYGKDIKDHNTDNNFYVWDPHNSTWVDITGDEVGQQICGPSNPNIQPACVNQLYYTAFSGNPNSRPTNLALAHNWTIYFDKNFGTKSMYTAGYVIDSNYVPAFLPEITPTN